jgi:hypothetical protein
MSSKQPLMEGQIFGRLTVTEYVNNFTVHCVCICGQKRTVQKRNLVKKLTKSCGCLLRETTIERSSKHGHAPRGRPSREYRSWYSMVRRCGDKARGSNAKDYHARGITVCTRWSNSFENFLKDVGICPGSGYSIDRIDNNKGYEPGNVRWATRVQQNRNTRKNKMLEWAGITLCLAEWCEQAGMPYRMVNERLRRGWPWPQALYTPKGQYY